jgi:threonine dehydrogenase-like Zn-dependent dehydrogenase
MKAIVNVAPGQLELHDWPLPSPGAAQVRISTRACGICATDLSMIDGWERTGFPAIPGHEWAGVIDAVGTGVDAALVGRPCVADNMLSVGGEVGFEHPGGYGEYFITEAPNLYLLPQDFPLPVATLIEPLAVAIRAFRRLHLEDRSSALILGDGPIGLLVLMLLQRAGVEHIVSVGGRTGRLATASSLGAETTVNYHEVGSRLAAAVRDLSGGAFPHVVETSGSWEALEACLELVASRGQVVIVGDYGAARADFLWLDLLHREFELIGSNSGTGAWPEAVRLATAGDLPLAQLVTHRFPAERFAEPMALVRSRQGDVIKVVLEW